jgi:putative acetyltransferase
MGWWWKSKRSDTASTSVIDAQARPAHVPRLRPIEPRDDEAIARILRAVMSEFGATGAGSSIGDPEVDGMFSAYAEPRAAYFVAADDDGVLVGGGGIGPLQGAAFEVCELRKMYLLPAARGHGTGERLLRQCLRAARGFGYHTCYLETLTGMRGAQRLYERAGFKPHKAPLGATGHFGCDRYFALDL